MNDFESQRRHEISDLFPFFDNVQAKVENEVDQPIRELYLSKISELRRSVQMYDPSRRRNFYNTLYATFSRLFGAHQHLLAETLEELNTLHDAYLTESQKAEMQRKKMYPPTKKPAKMLAPGIPDFVDYWEKNADLKNYYAARSKINEPVASESRYPSSKQKWSRHTRALPPPSAYKHHTPRGWSDSHGSHGGSSQDQQDYQHRQSTSQQTSTTYPSQDILAHPPPVFLDQYAPTGQYGPPGQYGPNHPYTPPGQYGPTGQYIPGSSYTSTNQYNPGYHGSGF